MIFLFNDKLTRQHRLKILTSKIRQGVFRRGMNILFFSGSFKISTQLVLTSINTYLGNGVRNYIKLLNSLCSLIIFNSTTMNKIMFMILKIISLLCFILCYKSWCLEKYTVITWSHSGCFLEYKKIYMTDSNEEANDILDGVTV